MSVLSLLKFIANHPLNNDRKLRSIVRFAQWQVSSRLAPGAIVYDWVNGARFLVRTGETGLTGNIYTGLHEFADMGYLLHVLCEDDLFVDVGANVGSYTILACAAKRARGYAFEPVPSTYKRLIENIRINNIDDRVACLNLGLGRQDGTILFTGDMDTVNHAIAEGEQHDNVVEVTVTSLDKALSGATPALMKIDVEGYETPVLEGGLRTLQDERLHSVIMELNGSGSRYGFDEPKILSTMLDHGFKTYSYNPISRELLDLKGKNLEQGNTLFIRNESLVRERIEAAPKFTIHGKTF